MGECIARSGYLAEPQSEMRFLPGASTGCEGNLLHCWLQDCFAGDAALSYGFGRSVVSLGVIMLACVHYLDSIVLPRFVKVM